MRILFLERFFSVKVADKAYPLLVGLQQIKLIIGCMGIVACGAPLVLDRLMKITYLHQARHVFVAGQAQVIFPQNSHVRIVRRMRVMATETIAFIQRTMPEFFREFAFFLLMAYKTELTAGCDNIKRLRVGLRFMT